MKKLLVLLLVLWAARLPASEHSFAMYEILEYDKNSVAYGDEPNHRLAEKPFLNSSHIKCIEVKSEKFGTVLAIELTKSGAEINFTTTTRLVKKRIAIFLDGQLKSTPTIISPSKQNTIVTGDFSGMDIKRLFPDKVCSGADFWTQWKWLWLSLLLIAAAIFTALVLRKKRKPLAESL